MLTDAKVRKLKPKAAPFKTADRDGLYLLVQPGGAKWWRWDFRYLGKRRTLSLGVYPDVELEDARAKLREERKRLAAGYDPGAVRQATRERDEAAIAVRRDTFETVGREWFKKHSAKLAPRTIVRTKWILEKALFPQLGARPIAGIEPPELLDALHRIEANGRHATAHRAKQIAGRVFRFAIVTGRARRDPSADLRGALAPMVSTSRAAVTDPTRIGELLRAIDGYAGSFVVGQALKLAPLVFVRPGELRTAEWSEIDLERAEWRIPAAKMKGRVLHLVPLSTQAVAILRAIHPLTGRDRYVFPSARTSKRPMSDNTLNAALRRLGYTKDEMTSHGFRAIASTRLNELGWRPDLIERQLAHVEKDQVRAAYNRAEHLDERRVMMQAWADVLDGLKQQKPTLIAAS